MVDRIVFNDKRKSGPITPYMPASNGLSAAEERRINNSISGIVGETKSNGAQWSISVRTEGSEVAYYRGRECLSSASLGKIVLLVALAEKAVSGDVSLEDVYTSTVQEVSGTGILQAVGLGPMSVGGLAYLVGSVSDNQATNLLINVVGWEKITEVNERYFSGWRGLLDYVVDYRTRGEFSSGSGEEYCSLIESALLGDGRVVDEAVNLITRWLSLGGDLSLVPHSLGNIPGPVWGVSGQEVSVLNKTGRDTGIMSDAGVMRRGSRAVSYAVLCNYQAGVSTGKVSAGAVQSTMNLLGELIVGEFLEGY